MNLCSIEDVDFENYFWTRRANDISEVVKPLGKYGITFFSQSRLYENGVDDCLSNKPLVQKLYIDLEMWKHIFVGQPSHYSNCVVRWEDIDPDSQYIRKYFSELQSHDIANGIIIVKSLLDHVEFYYFGSATSNYKINSFYLNNLDILYQFIDYFNDVGDDIIRDSYDHRVYYPDAVDNTILTSGEIHNTYHRNTNHGQTFLVMSDFYSLTKRERQCAQLLMLGNCCKRMASKMNLSTRTVEKHLQSLRRKTNSYNFSQMFSKLYNIKKTDIG